MSDLCLWEEDEDGIWHTSCGEAFQFTADGPAENGTRYCMYCGREINAKVWDKVWDEDPAPEEEPPHV